MRRKLLSICGLAIVALALPGCWRGSGSEVVTYTALDAEFSQPIFDDFQRQTGIRVLPKFDVESTKTLGLVNALVAERDRPRADVFWNNEILNTIRLEKDGLLEPYAPRSAEKFPIMDRAANGAWHGFAARARVLLVNTEKVGGEEPTSIEDLADPRWRGQVAMAKPLFGTTATQGACLFAVWGDERAKEYYRKLKANDVQILAGNKPVAQAVSAGQVAFGITDTDDAIGEIEQGHPMKIVYPDQPPHELGTLFIPNTVAILKGCPHPAAARRLVDYLLSEEVELKLAEGPSAQIPLNADIQAPIRVQTPHTIEATKVDFIQAAGCWDAAAAFLRDEFATAD